jgi:hypothetical protein
MSRRKRLDKLLKFALEAHGGLMNVLLSRKRFGGTARRLTVILPLTGNDLRVQLSCGQQPIFLFSVGRVVGLTEDELSDA